MCGCVMCATACVGVLCVRLCMCGCVMCATVHVWVYYVCDCMCVCVHKCMHVTSIYVCRHNLVKFVCLYLLASKCASKRAEVKKKVHNSEVKKMHTHFCS